MPGFRLPPAILAGFRSAMAPADAGADYQPERRRRFLANAPWAFAVAMVCATITTAFELVRFPERRGWALASEAAFLVVPTLALVLLRAFPQRSIGIGIAATNLLGLILNLYHAVVAGGNAVFAHFGLPALVPSEAVFPSAAALLSCARLAINAFSPSR